MKHSMRYLYALLLTIICLPALAAGDCPAIQSLTANDVQTGQPVTITWSYTGGTPETQTLTGHDFAEAVVIPAGQTSYTYTPSQPGEKQAQLTAVTACGTNSRNVKYHVKRCNVAAPPLAVSTTTVLPGGTVQASVPLLPGHDVRWEVRNGTASSTSGAAIDVIAGETGVVEIDAYVSRGSSCSVKVGATVNIEAPCAIAEPLMYHPDRAGSNAWFWLYVPQVPGLTVTFEAHGGDVQGYNEESIDLIAPASGSFSIDIIVSNGTCTRTFTRTFEVLPCSPTATVSAGTTGACGATTVVAEFTGDAPFQGEWSDGQFFYTFDSRIERTVSSAGVYTILYMFDAYCQGAVSGSAEAGASLPKPAFTVDPVVDGGGYGNATCPGMQRVATLDAPILAGAEVIWSITNGTIVSGQGTAELRFTGDAPGDTVVTAVLENERGCTSETFSTNVLTYGVPQVSVSVEPSTIGAGGSALVTVTQLNRYVVSTNLTSSLGDTLIPLGPAGENAYVWEYQSTHGGGVATITATVNNACGDVSAADTTLTIDGDNPVGATATVRAIGESCGQYYAYAEFTGVGPFSGTWSNGQTFTTEYPYELLAPLEPGTYTLVSFGDVNGHGTVTGEATFDFTALPRPDFAFDVETACPGSVITATLLEPLPEGATASWDVFGGTVLWGQGTGSITIQIDAETNIIQANVRTFSPTGCSPEWAHNYMLLPVSVQQPLFDLYGVWEGRSTQFTVYLDPNTASWSMENSMGDAMEVVAELQPNVYAVRYTSSHGLGSSTIRIYGTTECGLAFESTNVMQVVPAPPTATLTYEQGATCGAELTVTFTGVAPFSATWSDSGETFTTMETTYTKHVDYGGYYYVWGVTDANGNGEGGEADVWVDQPCF